MERLVEASYIVERDCRLLCADGRENIRSGGLVRTATAMTKAEEDQELVDTVCFAVKSRRRRDCSTLLVV